MRTQLLPWEILQGLKMDLNRPFGSGAFSMASQREHLIQGGSQTIPDQPGTTNETRAAICQHQRRTRYGDSSTTRPMRGVSTGSNGRVNDSLAARQLYARHLYVLAMALADTAALLADLQKTNPSGHDRRRDALDCPVGRERGRLSRPQQHHDSFPLRPEPVQRQRLEPRPIPLSTRSGVASGPSC